jgi:hypothetical protein
MKTPAAMTINTTNVNAAGQENRPDVSEFRIWMFDVEYWAFSSNHPKKVPPPTPDGREGRLFPPEQSSKSAQLLPELKRCRNKNFYKYAVFPGAPRESKSPRLRMSILRVARFSLKALKIWTTCGTARCAF